MYLESGGVLEYGGALSSSSAHVLVWVLLLINPPPELHVTLSQVCLMLVLSCER